MKQTFVKALVISCSILLFSFIACKSTRKNTEPVPVVKTDTLPTNKTSGVVTHAYQSSGCGTAVIITNPKSGNKRVLLPVGDLGAFDVEGLEITFHYHPLKKMNPPGCKTGAPASLSDIEKK